MCWCCRQGYISFSKAIRVKYSHCKMIHKAFPTRWSLQEIINTSLKEGSRDCGTGGAVHGHAGMEVRCLALSDHCRLRRRWGTPAEPHTVISHLQFCRSNSPRRLWRCIVRWRGHAVAEKRISRLISHPVQNYSNFWCDGNRCNRLGLVWFYPLLLLRSEKVKSTFLHCFIRVSGWTAASESEVQLAGQEAA